MCISAGYDVVNVMPNGSNLSIGAYTIDEENHSVPPWVVAAGHQLKGVAHASAEGRDPRTLKYDEWPGATGHWRGV